MRKKNQNSDFIKECICSALISLMYKKNLDDITISEICKQSGYGRTTYYRYFTNKKEDLLLYYASRRWNQIKDENEKNDNTDYVLLFFNTMYRSKDFHMMLVKQGLFNLLYNLYFNEFTIKSTDGKDLKYVTAFVSGGLYGIALDWVNGGCKDTPEVLMNNLIDSYSNLEDLLLRMIKNRE